MVNRKTFFTWKIFLFVEVFPRWTAKFLPQPVSSFKVCQNLFHSIYHKVRNCLWKKRLSKTKKLYIRFIVALITTRVNVEHEMRCLSTSLKFILCNSDINSKKSSLNTLPKLFCPFFTSVNEIRTAISSLLLQRIHKSSSEKFEWKRVN